MNAMIIGLIGEACSGKTTISKYFEENLGFSIIRLDETNNEDIINEDISPTSINSYNSLEKFEKMAIEDNGITIKIDDLLSFNTKTVTKSTIKLKIREIKNKYIIITPFNNYEDYMDLKNKTTFRLIGIECPTKIRYQNYSSKYSPNFEDFLDLDYKCSNRRGFKQMQTEALLHITNNRDLSQLKTIMSEMFINLEKCVRPSWEDYFMQVAHVVAQRSNCLKQRVGCVIVNQNRIVTVGYNGTPTRLKNCYAGGCERCNSDAKSGEGLDMCVCIHAEENAVNLFLKIYLNS